MNTIFKTNDDLKKNDFFIFLPKTYKIAPINISDICKFEDLKEITSQKQILLKNTLNFSGNVLLWGAKGMGKSTLVKSVIKYINMKYKKELIRSMNYLAKKPNTIFLGQSVEFSGNAIYNTLIGVPIKKKLEMPVFEDAQMGMSMGLA